MGRFEREEDAWLTERDARKARMLKTPAAGVKRSQSAPKAKGQSATNKETPQ